MTQNSRGLSGKLGLITGAAHRVGAQIARTLHATGMDLVLHYRSSVRGAETIKAELERERPGSVMLLQADLHDARRFPDLMAQVSAFRGRLDLLVNNASSFYPTPFDTTNEAQWDDLIGSNLKGPFFLAQSAAALLRANRGCIVNLVDIHAERPLRDHAVYSIAKAGNAMMVKSLAVELGPEVRVNGVAPGAILWPEQERDAAHKEQVVSRTPLGRIGEPPDIARTVLFLAREAPYITGQIIAVDGGRGIRH